MTPASLLAYPRVNGVFANLGYVCGGKPNWKCYNQVAADFRVPFAAASIKC
jgi:hypothetical protein